MGLKSEVSEGVGESGHCSGETACSTVSYGLGVYVDGGLETSDGAEEPDIARLDAWSKGNEVRMGGVEKESGWLE